MQKVYLLNNYFLFLVLGVLILVACNAKDTPTSSIPRDISLTYQREGGIAGINQEWTIYPDGRIIAADGQELQVSSEAATDLLSRSATIESANLSKSYVADNECCDQFFYTIIIKVGDQETTLQTSDGANHPASITLLIEEIERLIATAEPTK